MGYDVRSKREVSIHAYYLVILAFRNSGMISGIWLPDCVKAVLQCWSFDWSDRECHCGFGAGPESRNFEGFSNIHLQSSV